MKKITLIRHAKVAIKDDEKISSVELKKWVEAYDSAEIDNESVPDKQVYEAARDANIILSSRLKRSIDSIKVLGYTPYDMNALFDEAAVPDASIPIIRLKPKRWLMLLRVLLLLGLGRDDNSFKASKERAKKAAGHLIRLSDKHDSIVLVGHGGMNWLIRKELLASGWVVQETPSNAHWGMTIIVS